MDTIDIGWPASKTLATRSFTIAGVSFAPGIADDDDVELVLRYVMQRVADEVEKPVGGQCSGFSFRANKNDSSVLSRHSGGVALDHNSLKHKNAVATVDSWEAAQIKAIHKILDDLDELCGVALGTRVVRWGGDYHHTPDSMHFEINVSPADLRDQAARLREKVEALMVTPDDERKIASIVDARIEAAIPGLVRAVLDAAVDEDSGVTVRRALRRAGKKNSELTDDIVRKVTMGLSAKLSAGEVRMQAEGEPAANPPA